MGKGLGAPVLWSLCCVLVTFSFYLVNPVEWAVGEVGGGAHLHMNQHDVPGHACAVFGVLLIVCCVWGVVL